ncbi:MAG: VWA domain-containing protein [Xanthobacteraceae bacterium]|nr:VWA domain-containing protein [Xanthobacteraceae bacterium]
MRIGIAFDHLCGRLKSFSRSDRGNVIMTFALATIPMIALVGAAVDYSRGNSAKAAMQSAVDATALILSKEAQGLTQTQLNTKADAIFNAQFHRSDVTNLVVTPNFVNVGNGSFKLTLAATGRVPTSFTRVIGQQKIDLSVSNEIVWGVKRLELALALDVTGSMASNNKITELKTAAKSLLTTLKAAAKKDGDIKVAIVPFNVDVNTNPTNVNANWLDWSDWAGAPAIIATWLATASNQNAWDRAGPGRSCPFTTGNHGFRCADGPASNQNDTTVTTIPSSGANSGLICPSRDDGSKSTAATGLLLNRYHNGCFTSVEKANTDWHPVNTGSSASCGGLPSSQCQCSGSGSNRVCAFIPTSNWQPYAQGSGQTCGNLPASACQCFGSGSSKVCKQKTYTHTWAPRPKTAWNGCVRDRNQDFDVASATLSYVATNVSMTNINNTSENYPQAASPATSDAFQPHQFYSCPAALMPLSFDWTALNNKIDELQPVGNTNVTIGLTWGFHAVSSTGPLANAAPPAADLEKVIILLTDGDNTQNRWTQVQADIDARTAKACAVVKAANIKIYTVRVIDGNAALLQACATKPDMYYNVQNASQLNAVFTTIAQSLANLRIAK